MSKKRIKEMGKRAREKKTADLAKQYYKNSALAQAAARRLASRPIEAPSFRQVVDIETHGGARFFVQHPDGTTHPLRNAPPDLAERVFRQRSSAFREQIEAAVWGGISDRPLTSEDLIPVGDTHTLIPRTVLQDAMERYLQTSPSEHLQNLQGVQGVSIGARVRGQRAESVGSNEQSEEYGQSAVETTPLLAIGGREADRVNEAAFFERALTEEEVQSVASTMIHRAMNDPESDEGSDRLHALMRGRIQEQAERLRLGLTTVNEVAESLGIVVPSFADMNEVPHEDLVRALATGNDSQLSEEFISQHLSEPVPTVKVFPNGITPWKKEGEPSEDAEPTAQEQVESLLESPDVPDCVRWNFVAGLAEEDLLRGWENDDKNPPSDVLEAIKHVRMFSRGETVHQDEFRMMLHLLFLKGPLSAALSASSTFQGTVPYEWQLAHLRNLIAEHNKRRFPLLLCLKERAQRIKQAPSYGQQLEEVLYAS